MPKGEFFKAAREKKGRGRWRPPCRILSATPRATSIGIAVRIHIGTGRAKVRMMRAMEAEPDIGQLTNNEAEEEVGLAVPAEHAAL